MNEQKDKDIWVENGEIRRVRHQIHQYGTRQVNNSQNTLSIEVAVCNQPNDEGGNNGTPGLCRKSHANLCTGCSKVTSQKSPQCNKPCAPRSDERRVGKEL